MVNDDLQPHFEWFAKRYKQNVGSKVSKKIDIVRHEMPEQFPELGEFIKSKK